MMNSSKDAEGGPGADETETPEALEQPLLDPDAAITRQLRALYDSVREEAIPERFLDLLERLDEAERKAGSSS